jgi:TonB family protein
MWKFATVLLASLGLVASSSALAGDEPPIEGEGRAKPYLEGLHAKVHKLWTDSFLAMAEGHLAKDHPINDRTRAAELALTLTVEGKLADVKVAKTSGSSDFDASALDVVKASAPFAVAPEDVLSDDGKVHVLWRFARDDRRCSGVSVQLGKLALEAAVPTLVAQGREALAIERLKEADEKDRLAAFSQLARAWLDRLEDDKALVLQVAVANATAGDERGAERLRKALNTDEAGIAAPALASLKVSLCDLLKERLADPQSKAAALSVLSPFPDGECISAVAGLAQDRKAAVSDRVAAVVGLGAREEPEAKAALKELFKDAAAPVRAAAILAEARPGAGKGAVFRLTALLRDPSIEIRTAAAAALVRAGGEEALSQLFLLFKERDARAYEAVARELGALSGESSAQMLMRFVRKDDRRVQLAGARALARRQDPFAAKAQATLATSTDAELRFLAAPTLTDPDQRKGAAGAPEGYAWTDSCVALMQAGGKLAAVDWILAQFPKLGPEARVELMGAWLAANRAGK